MMSSLRAFTQASLHSQLVLTPCSNNPFVVDFVGYSPNVERDRATLLSNPLGPGHDMNPSKTTKGRYRLGSQTLLDLFVSYWLKIFLVSTRKRTAAKYEHACFSHFSQVHTLDEILATLDFGTAPPQRRVA